MSQYTAKTWSYRADSEPITNINILPSTSQLRDLAWEFLNVIGEPCGFRITVANANGADRLHSDNAKIYYIDRISKQRAVEILNENMALLLQHTDIAFAVWGKSKSHPVENDFYGEGIEIKEQKKASIVTRSGAEVFQILEGLGIGRKERTSDGDWNDWIQSIKKTVNSQESALDVTLIVERFKAYGFDQVEWERD